MSAWLLDTNVVLRSIDAGCAQHAIARACIGELAARREMVFVSNQTLFEMWVVATRSIDHRGLGRSESEASSMLDGVQSRFLILADPEQIVKEWRRLIESYHVTSYKAHDMRFAAYARLHRIPRILTFNSDDFKSVKHEIEAVHPSDFIANPSAY